MELTPERLQEVSRRIAEDLQIVHRKRLSRGMDDGAMVDVETCAHCRVRWQCVYHQWAVAVLMGHAELIGVSRDGR